MSNGPYKLPVSSEATTQMPVINFACDCHGCPLTATSFDAGQDGAVNEISLPQEMTGCQRVFFSVCTEGASLCPETMYHAFTEDFLRQVWPESFNPPTALSNMNVSETAVWVETLSRFKGWNEAGFYARAFDINGICGHMLSSLTCQSIKSELGIIPYGHRFEIVQAIRQNELTLMNPCIVSPSPDVASMIDTFRRRQECRLRQSQLRDKLTEHPKQDVKRQLESEARPHLSKNRRVLGRVMSDKQSFYKKTYDKIISSKLSDFSIEKT